MTVDVVCPECVDLRGVYSDTTQLNSTDPVEQRTAKSVGMTMMDLMHNINEALFFLPHPVVQSAISVVYQYHGLLHNQHV